MRVSFVFEALVYEQRLSENGQTLKGDLRIDMEIDKLKDHNDYIKEILVTCDDTEIVMQFVAKRGHVFLSQFHINGENFFEKGETEYGGKIVADWCPLFMPRLALKEGAHYSFKYLQFPMERLQEELNTYLVKEKQEQRNRICSLLLELQPYEKFLDTLQRELPAFPQESMRGLYDRIVFCSINNIFDTIDLNMYAELNSSFYIAPLRAATDRYYRYKNLDVKGIDADGENMPMYLTSLSETKRKELNKWLLKAFGFEIKIVPSGEGNFELKVKQAGSNPHNIMDVGFGYSQILPILIQIWNAIDVEMPKSIDASHLSSRKKPNCIIAIEQPELHLHPRVIRMFAKALCLCIQKASNTHVRFIIETHSKDFLDKVGELIEEKEMDKDLVNVVLFNAHKEGMEKEVESANYSEDGILEHWPYGFFDEDAYTDM